MAIIWITHDLALAAGLADKVAVMYAGYIVEQAPVHELFRRPRHPYTLALLRALPRFDGPRSGRLEPIPGAPPDLPPGIPRPAPSLPAVPSSWIAAGARTRPCSQIGPGQQSACWQWEEHVSHARCSGSGT